MDRGPSANHTRNVGSSNVDSSQRLLRLPRFQQHLHNGEEVRGQQPAIVSQHWNRQKFFLILFLSHLLFSGKSKRWYTKIPPLSQSRQSCFRFSLAWYTLQSLERKQ